MPFKSEAQRRALYAAAAGNSTLGIPKEVGQKFVAHDEGGKLPVHAQPEKLKKRALSGVK